MSHVFREYIERVLFHPPEPLLHYPLDLDEVCPDSKRLYEASGVPCVCATHAAPKYWVVYFHGKRGCAPRRRG